MIVSREIMLAEIQGARDTLDKWIERLNAGIPGQDVPGTEEAYDRFLQELGGELMIVSGKTENLAAIITGER